MGKRQRYKPSYAVVDKNERTLTFHIDNETFEKLNDIAKARDITRGYLGRTLMLKALANRTLMLKALAELEEAA